MIHYRTAAVGDHQIFYREAGDPNQTSLLLLHGFPSSSHMFRNLIPLLSDRFHIVAPGSSWLRLFAIAAAIAVQIYL